MPTPLTGAAVLTCAHGGTGQPVATAARVQLGGRPVLLLAIVPVTGCPNPEPPNGTGRCVTAQYPAGSARVRAGGQPLLVQEVPAVCVPTGVPLTAAAPGQYRVRVT